MSVYVNILSPTRNYFQDAALPSDAGLSISHNALSCIVNIACHGSA